MWVGGWGLIRCNMSIDQHQVGQSSGWVNHCQWRPDHPAVWGEVQSIDDHVTDHVISAYTWFGTSQGSTHTSGFHLANLWPFSKGLIFLGRFPVQSEPQATNRKNVQKETSIRLCEHAEENTNAKASPLLYPSCNKL